MGDAVPCGKLAETYPLRYADVPSAGFYENGGKQAQYREAFYVGYRYYDAADKAVLFPFGHGLSYTTFQYEDLVVSEAELDPPHSLTVSCRVTNTGTVAGAEVVQLYARDEVASLESYKTALSDRTQAATAIEYIESAARRIADAAPIGFEDISARAQRLEQALEAQLAGKATMTDVIGAIDALSEAVVHR